MNQIWTASWSTIVPEDAIPVGISRGTPRRKGGFRRLRELEPGPWFRTVAPNTYLELYGDLLRRLDPGEVRDRLFSFGAMPVLLCFERAEDIHSGTHYCHWHLVAQWLEDRLGIEVPEVGHPQLDRFGHLVALGIKPPNYRAGRLIDGAKPHADNLGAGI
jgi:hypothetical protein